MRILLVSVCCLLLAGLAGAAQHDQDQDNAQPKNKKEKGQQVVAPAAPVGGKGKYRTQGNVSGAGANANLKYHTQGNVSGVGANTNLKYRTQGNVSGAGANTNLKYHTQGNVSGAGANVSSQTNVSGKLKTQNFHPRHFDLATTRTKPEIQNVKFRAGARIQNSQNWQGTKYVRFRSYSPQWHERDWWRSHHSRIVFVFGGWYFWDGGYYEPAWGYAPDAYYAYDGPIYTGSEDLDPGQAVANVQAALQEQGYYQGEIDGILGPGTRAALAEYQSAQGLEPTGAIDEPTMKTLGMA